MKNWTRIGIALVAVLVTAMQMQAATNLPYDVTFETNEGFTLGQTLTGSTSSPFVFSGLGGVIVSTPTSLDGSAQLLYSPDSFQIEMDLTSPQGTRTYHDVWWSAFVKLKPQTNGNEPSLDTDAAVFYVDEAGRLWANDGGVYTNVYSGLNPNQWIGVSVHLDYSNRVWNLYSTSANYTMGNPLEKRNTAPLDFNPAYSNQTPRELQVAKVEGETYIDNISMMHNVSTFGAPVVGTPQSGGIQLTLDDVLSGVAVEYFPEAERNMNAGFGEALASLMIAGDIVSYWDPATTNFVKFTLDGNGSWGTNTLDFPVSPMRGALFTLKDDTNGLRNASLTIAYDPDDQNGTLSTTTIDIENGWNLLATPMSASTRRIINGDSSAQLKINSPSNGDIIYLRRRGVWIILRYSSDLGGWIRRGTTLANEEFPAQSAFWYRRSSTNEVAYTWGLN